MSKKEKILLKIKNNPNGIIWDELTSLLRYYGYSEFKTGKTSGSRVKYIGDNKDIIRLYKPHPSNIVKRYVIEQIIKKLEL